MMPVYKDGLSVLAGKAKKAMAEGHVPAEDTGADAYVEYPSEWYAELVCGHPRIPDNLLLLPQSNVSFVPFIATRMCSS